MGSRAEGVAAEESNLSQGGLGVVDPCLLLLPGTDWPGGARGENPPGPHQNLGNSGPLRSHFSQFARVFRSSPLNLGPLTTQSAPGTTPRTGSFFCSPKYAKYESLLAKGQSRVLAQPSLRSLLGSLEVVESGNCGPVVSAQPTRRLLGNAEASLLETGASPRVL